MSTPATPFSRAPTAAPGTPSQAQQQQLTNHTTTTATTVATQPPLPPPSTFDILPPLHLLLSRLLLPPTSTSTSNTTTTTNSGAGSNDTTTNPVSSSSPQTPLEIQHLAHAAGEVRRRIQRARQALDGLADMQRAPAEQEEELAALRRRVEGLRELLGVLGERAGGMLGDGEGEVVKSEGELMR